MARRGAGLMPTEAASMWTRLGSEGGRGLGLWKRGVRRRTLCEDGVEERSSCRRGSAGCCWRWGEAMSGVLTKMRGEASSGPAVLLLRSPPGWAGEVDKARVFTTGGW